MICVPISIALISPAYFAVTVEKSSDSPAETRGYWTLTTFGQNAAFQLYSVLVLLVETFIPLIMLIVLNIVSLMKFRKVMETKRQVQTNGQQNLRTNEAKDRFTRLIICLSFICIFTRSLDTVISIVYRIKLFYNITLSNDMSALIDFIYATNIMLLIAEHSLDCVLYFMYDCKMRSLFFVTSSHTTYK